MWPSAPKFHPVFSGLVEKLEELKHQGSEQVLAKELSSVRNRLLGSVK
jgi:hypothetical protein